MNWSGQKTEGLILAFGGLIGILATTAVVAAFGYALIHPTPPSPAPTPSTVASEDKPEAFGAIEIGASGIKGTVWSIAPAQARQILSTEAADKGFRYTAFDKAKVEHYEDTNATIEDKANVPAAVASVGDFFKRMRASHIAKDHIFIVASSGVADLPYLNEVVDSVTKLTGDKPDVVTAAQECSLTFDWIVPVSRTYEAVVIDAGSGNTKACYVDRSFYSDQYHAFELMPFGTESYAKHVAAQSGGKDFASASEAGRAQLISLISVATKDNPGLNTRKRYYLAGGGVWETATLLHPDQSKEDWVPLDIPADFETVRARAASGSPYNVGLSAIQDASVSAAAEKDLKRAAKTFTADQLLAGMDVLISIDQGLGLGKRKASVLFARPARDAWISRYLVTKIARLQRS